VAGYIEYDFLSKSARVVCENEKGELIPCRICNFPEYAVNWYIDVYEDPLAEFRIELDGTVYFTSEPDADGFTGIAKIRN